MIVLQYTEEEIKNFFRAILREELTESSEIVAKQGNEELLTRKETAALLRISTVTLDRYNREGRIEEAHRIGKPVRYLKSTVLDAITNNVKTKKPKNKNR